MPMLIKSFLKERKFLDFNNPLVDNYGVNMMFFFLLFRLAPKVRASLLFLNNKPPLRKGRGGYFMRLIDQ
ncbi:hypothetical protein C0W65_19330 [Bacillus subtilis]|nr:hypothetical protein C0W65_19330 [Bacillus subtilis]